MNTEKVRQQMVEQQVRTWDVSDASVLDTIAEVPRDHYVPQEFADCAYADIEIPLPHDQCMLRPSIVGKILQAVDIHAGDEVLEIGTGTGYLSHCMAKTAASVMSIDIYDDFTANARSKLEEEAVDNVELHCMDAMRELPPGEFDAIIVTGAMHTFDQRFADALKSGGRLFVVVGKSPVMTATLVNRTYNGELTARELFETDIPALVMAAERPAFLF